MDKLVYLGIALLGGAVALINQYFVSKRENKVFMFGFSFDTKRKNVVKIFSWFYLIFGIFVACLGIFLFVLLIKNGLLH